MSETWVHKFRDGMVVEVREYPTLEEALEAVDLAGEAMAQANVEKLGAFLAAFDMVAWARGEADLSLLDPAVIYEDTTLPDPRLVSFHRTHAPMKHTGIAFEIAWASQG
jgi:hypothetical protein